MTIKAHFDGKTIVLDEPVTLIAGQVVTVLVGPAAKESTWPVDYFDKLAGSMPDLERAPQGEFEERTPLT